MAAAGRGIGVSFCRTTPPRHALSSNFYAAMRNESTEAQSPLWVTSSHADDRRLRPLLKVERKSASRSIYLIGKSLLLGTKKNPAG